MRAALSRDTNGNQHLVEDALSLNFPFIRDQLYYNWIYKRRKVRSDFLKTHNCITNEYQINTSQLWAVVWKIHVTSPNQNWHSQILTGIRDTNDLGIFSTIIYICYKVSYRTMNIQCGKFSSQNVNNSQNIIQKNSQHVHSKTKNDAKKGRRSVYTVPSSQSALINQTCVTDLPEAIKMSQAANVQTKYTD